jgi:hypothetical protein
MGFNKAKTLIVVEIQNSEIGLADTGRVGQDGTKYRLQFAGRAADDLEHVGGGGLLLQGFAQFAEQAVFSIAITACLAKLLTSSICFSVNGRTSWR